MANDGGFGDGTGFGDRDSGGAMGPGGGFGGATGSGPADGSGPTLGPDGLTAAQRDRNNRGTLGKVGIAIGNVALGPFGLAGQLSKTASKGAMPNAMESITGLIGGSVEHAPGYDAPVGETNPKGDLSWGQRDKLNRDAWAVYQRVMEYGNDRESRPGMSPDMRDMQRMLRQWYASGDPELAREIVTRDWQHRRTNPADRSDATGTPPESIRPPPRQPARSPAGLLSDAQANARAHGPQQAIRVPDFGANIPASPRSGASEQLLTQAQSGGGAEALMGPASSARSMLANNQYLGVGGL